MLHFGMNMPYYLMVIYGSIMIVMVLVLRGLLKNRLPRFVFPVLWSIVLLRFILPFSLSLPLSFPVPLNPFALQGGVVQGFLLQEATLLEGTLPEDAVESATAVNERQASAAGNIDIISENISNHAATTLIRGSISDYWRSGRIYFLMLIAYFVGLATVVGILGYQKYGYSKKLKKGLLIEHNETINEILRSMDMGHVLVFSNDEIASPMVGGLLNPHIYLPTQMDFRNTVLLRHVLAHETMHIRHRDNWLKGILVIVLCLNWYNPLVWLMAKCLVSDLEAACDFAVLRQCGEEAKKEYAFSLLAMALTGRHTTLLYSAFSRTEVEKRVKNILSYKKMTFLALLSTALFMAGSMVAFATVGQAPFWEDLTAYCASSYSRWGVRVTITRDIALGEYSQERAEEVIFSVLGTGDAKDPKVIEDRIRTALAEEFGVEKGAFNIMMSLCLSREEVEEEYEVWGITRAGDGFWLYQEQPIRVYEDKLLGSYQSREEGEVDISVQRDIFGEIASVTVWRQGDPEFDNRTRRIEQYRRSAYGTAATVEDTVIVQSGDLH